MPINTKFRVDVKPFLFLEPCIFSARMRYDLYSNVTDLQPSFFENTGVQDVISALITDTSVLQSIINSSLLTILRNFVILIGSVAMLLYTDLHLTAYEHCMS
jgi:ATP-binding cassette subfamily B protein